MKYNLTIIFLLLASLWAGAQTWQPMTPTINSQPYEGQSMYGKIAIDEHGTPYVTFNNPKNKFQPPVVKFNGHSWEPVGDPQSYTEFRGSNIAIHPDGTPYIVYDSDTVVARKFNGMDWIPVGTNYLRHNSKDIAMDSTGTPYVVYSTDNEIVVMKLNGDTWETVGGSGFGIGRSKKQLEIAPDGMPWVACTEYPGYIGSVWKFNGTGWEIAGTPESLKGVTFPTLAFAPDGTAYIADRALHGENVKVLKLKGNNWEIVGNRIFPSGSAFPDIAVDATGTVYLALSDSTNADKATVMKYKNSNWENAGNASFSDTPISDLSLAIDPAGIPYIAYTDRYIGFDDFIYKLRVSKLTDNHWVSLGGASITNGFAGLLSAVTASNGWIYMAYSYDERIDLFDRWHKTSVTRYNGTSWERLGNEHFWHGVENEQIAVGPDGTPYIAYSDSANELKVTVERFINDQWEKVGNEGFTESNAVPSIAVGTDHMPYVAYTIANKAYIKKFNGTEWKDVGTPEIGNSTSSIVIVLDKADTPYVAYTDPTNALTLTVKKFTGGEWKMVGEGVVSDKEYPFYLTIDPLGNPYILYGNKPASIKKFNGTNWETLNNQDMPSDLMDIHLVFDSSGNVYVAYQDAVKDNKASVIRYNGQSWEPFGNRGFTEYPASSFRLLADNKDNFYFIYSNDGLRAYKYLEDCMNPTAGGTIADSQSGCDSFDPALITSSSDPEGHKGTLEYLWQRSTISNTSGFTDIIHNDKTYNPGVISQTTWYRRLARVSCMTDWSGVAVSNVVKMTVVTLPELRCPANDTVFQDPGSAFARKTYSALPKGAPDSLAVYLVNGKPITFPYDFPVGITEVEVKANNHCSDEVLCSFKVTVRQATGIDELDASNPSVEIYPNPFTHEMTVEIANPSLSKVSVDIFSISGQRIKTLARALKGAKITLSWNGTNEQGKQMPEGMYLLKVNEQTRKVMKR